MKIAEGLEMLSLSIGFGDRQMVIHPTVIYNSDSCVVVDTGMPGNEKEIRTQIKQAGIPATRLQAIILTHQDIDHVGSLPEFLAESGRQLDVYAHEDDKPYIDGEKPFIKMRPEVKQLFIQSLPEKEFRQFEAAFSPSTPANVNHTLTDGERLPFGGGLTVIHTPGHTPGHICLYHESSKTLIAGDAMVVHEGELYGPRPEVTPDMEAAIESLRKLRQFPIETVICYHGGVYKGNVAKRLEELTA